MSDEPSFALEDAIEAIAKLECPSDWARYCQLAHVPGSDSGPEAGARNLLRTRAVRRYDTNYDWVDGAPHLEEALDLEHKFLELFLAWVRDGRCMVCHFAGDDLRRAVIPPELLTRESLKLDHNRTMLLAGRKLCGVHVVFTAPQEAPDVHAIAGSQEAPAVIDPSPEAPAVIDPSPEAPGPKPGQKTEKNRACSEALNILNDDAKRPAKGHGRRRSLARMVQKKVEASYKLNSIEKIIRETVAGWEKDNPNE